jgi:hypothetical protein
MTERWIREVTPRVAVVVDESLCICLRTEHAGLATITDVGTLIDALQTAQMVVEQTEASDRQRRPGRSRPRCARCPGEVRPLPQQPGSGIQEWEHVDPPADGHAAVYDIGILSYAPAECGHKAEVDRAFAYDGLHRPPEGYPGTTRKVLPEDWEYDR